MSRLTSIRRLNDHIAELEVMLDDASRTGDVMSELAFEEMLEQAREDLQNAEGLPSTKADAVILFEGSPVIGREAIDAAFAGAMLQSFQHAINIVSAASLGQTVGERGPVPANVNHPLYITDLAYGSFGFVLEEEISSQREAFPTSEKAAVDQVLDLLFTASDTESKFSHMIENVDKRTFAALKGIYERLEKAHARMKAFVADQDIYLDDRRVAVACDRLTRSSVEEEFLVFSATLMGLSTSKRIVDLRRDDTDEFITGKAGAKLSQDYLERIEREGVTLGSVFLVDALFKVVHRPDGSESRTVIVRDLSPIDGAVTD